MSHMTLDDRVYIQEGLDNNLNPNLITHMGEYTNLIKS